MAIDIYSTYYMLAAIQEKPIEYSFLRDRYFTTGGADIFNAPQVLVDYQDREDHYLAPFVSEKYGGVPYKRTGFETHLLEPGHVSVSRPLTVDELNSRQLGESIFSTRTPAERARLLLMQDMDALDRLIARREEAMCAEVMLTNAIDMSYLIDDTSKEKIERIVHYYNVNTEETNPTALTPSVKWDTDDADWKEDVGEAAQALADDGRPVSDLIVAPDIAKIILKDTEITKLLDNRRLEIGEIDPRWQNNGVTYLGRLNFGGFDISIFAYRGTYIDPDTGAVTRFIPDGCAVLTAPNCGALKYGAVTQMDYGSTEFRTYAGSRVPKLDVDTAHNSRTLTLSSKPLAAPVMKNPWYSFHDCLSA